MQNKEPKQILEPTEPQELNVSEGGEDSSEIDWEMTTDMASIQY